MIHIIKKITLWPFSNKGPSINDVTSKGEEGTPKRWLKLRQFEILKARERAFFWKKCIFHPVCIFWASEKYLGFKARKWPKMHVSQSAKVDQLDIYFSSVQRQSWFLKNILKLWCLKPKVCRTLKLILSHMPSDFQFTLLSQKSKEISLLKWQCK